LKEKEAPLIKDEENLQQSALSLPDKIQKAVNTNEGKDVDVTQAPRSLLNNPIVKGDTKDPIAGFMKS
jgi:antitoxin component of MazEF toxin-antitoxin module